MSPAAPEEWHPQPECEINDAGLLQAFAIMILDDWRYYLRGLPVRFHLHRQFPNAGSAEDIKPGRRWKEGVAQQRGRLPRRNETNLLFHVQSAADAAGLMTMENGDFDHPTTSWVCLFVIERDLHELGIKLIEPSDFTPLDFTMNDIVSFPLLASDLKSEKRKVDKWLASQLSQGSDLSHAAPTQSLLQSLNAILRFNPCIFDTDVFEHVHLRSRTRELLSINQEPSGIVRLNRLLLEDAYPGRLARHRTLATNRYEVTQSLPDSVDHVLILDPDAVTGEVCAVLRERNRLELHALQPRQASNPKVPFSQVRHAALDVLLQECVRRFCRG